MVFTIDGTAFSDPSYSFYPLNLSFSHWISDDKLNRINSWAENIQKSF